MSASVFFLGIVLVLSLLLTAFFAAAESSLARLNRYRLRHQARTGSRAARRLLSLLAQSEALFFLLLIGNNGASLAAAALATSLGLRQGGASLPLLLGLTLALLVALKLGASHWGARHAERFAARISLPLQGLRLILAPLLWLVQQAQQHYRQPGRHAGHSSAQNELRQLLHDVFLLRQQRRQLAQAAPEHITVNDIMVPRGEVQGINLDDDIGSIETQLRRSQYTRLPVYRGELNHCIGTLHVRNSTRFLGRPTLTKAEILQYVREPYFVPESTPLPAQLLQFQKLKRRFALVVDEYGDVQGIITLEAILEEIVGGFSPAQGAHHEDMQAQADGSWLVDGSVAIRDINRHLQWQLPSQGPRTLNGLITDILQTIPESALSLRIADYCIEVVQTKDNAVKAARLSRINNSTGKAE